MHVLGEGRPPAEETTEAGVTTQNPVPLQVSSDTTGQGPGTAGGTSLTSESATTEVPDNSLNGINTQILMFAGIGLAVVIVVLLVILVLRKK
jgi:hypothetical protein